MQLGLVNLMSLGFMGLFPCLIVIVIALVIYFIINDILIDICISLILRLDVVVKVCVMENSVVLGPKNVNLRTLYMFMIHYF